jgi:predicted RNase H-like nuclease
LNPAAVFEVHPEVSFTVMNGDKPIPEPKKVNRRVHALQIDR